MFRPFIRTSLTLLVVTAAIPLPAESAARGSGASQQVCAVAFTDDASAKVEASRLSHEISTLVELKKFRQAAVAARRALQITETAEGTSSRNYAADLYTLANLYMRQGDFFNSEPMLLQVLDIDKKIFGPEHPEVGMDLCGMGTFYARKAEAAEALRRTDASQGLRLAALAQQDAALRLLEKNLGSPRDAQRYAQCLHGKGRTLLALNRYDAALAALDEASRRLEPTLRAEAAGIYLLISKAALDRGDHRRVMTALARLEGLREHGVATDAEDEDAPH